MTKKGFEILTQALSATTITEPMQLTEQERQALYTTIYYTDDEKRRIWAAERLIDRYRITALRKRSGERIASIEPFNFHNDVHTVTALCRKSREVLRFVKEYSYDQETVWLANVHLCGDPKTREIYLKMRPRSKGKES